jgi:hypothetical protein
MKIGCEQIGDWAGTAKGPCLREPAMAILCGDDDPIASTRDQPIKFSGCSRHEVGTGIHSIQSAASLF